MATCHASEQLVDVTDLVDRGGDIADVHKQIEKVTLAGGHAVVCAVGVWREDLMRQLGGLTVDPSWRLSCVVALPPQTSVSTHEALPMGWHEERFVDVVTLEPMVVRTLVDAHSTHGPIDDAVIDGWAATPPLLDGSIRVHIPVSWVMAGIDPKD